MTGLLESSVLDVPLPPRGLKNIIATFGNIFEYIEPDQTPHPRWRSEQLATAALPFSIPLSWDRSRQVSRLTCHRLLTPLFERCFQNIQNARLEQEISSFGGCFTFRAQRNGTRLSTHCWGIAIDLNPEANAQGTQGEMHPGIISIFRGAGFSWGGDWAGKAKDPMHFQFCSGY